MKLRSFASFLVVVAAFAGSVSMRADGERPFDEAPTLLRTVAPAYPADLRRDGIDGLVAVSVTIDEQGNVASATVSKSSHVGFERAAMDAVAQWKFKPAKKAGQPVSAKIMLPVKFTAQS